MPNMQMDDKHETHLGWQSSEIDSHEGPDHLVIDGSYVKEPDVQNNAVISFEAPVQKLNQQAQDSNTPSFIDVDSEGLESPLDLLGSQEPLDDQAVPPLIWFGDDESEVDTSLNSSDPHVFS